MIEFDEDNVDEILREQDVKVEWQGGSFPCWGMYWKHGGISWMSLDKEPDEQQARRASAMFCYLWLNGIPAHLADKLAESYVNFV
jgi:hypothetical protein